LRAKLDLSNDLKLIWGVQSRAQKYFDIFSTQITGIILAVSSHEEGRWPSLLTLDEMRWTLRHN
jgi:hypothetical protein